MMKQAMTIVKLQWQQIENIRRKSANHAKESGCTDEGIIMPANESELRLQLEKTFKYLENLHAAMHRIAKQVCKNQTLVVC